jgi:hypothetical protein
MSSRLIVSTAVTALLLAGCASVPSGPNVMVLPGSGKPFDAFRVDDQACRDFAMQQIGGRAREQAAHDAALKSAAIATAVGAVAGAAVGGREGAGVGAGAGLVIGSVAGAGAAQTDVSGSQRQYDMAYVQCMYAKGHRVPVSGNYLPAPGVGVPPPPPAGSPPPPPGR